MLESTEQMNRFDKWADQLLFYFRSTGQTLVFSLRQHDFSIILSEDLFSTPSPLTSSAIRMWWNEKLHNKQLSIQKFYLLIETNPMEMLMRSHSIANELDNERFLPWDPSLIRMFIEKSSGSLSHHRRARQICTRSTATESSNHIDPSLNSCLW